MSSKLLHGRWAQPQLLVIGCLLTLPIPAFTHADLIPGPRPRPSSPPTWRRNLAIPKPLRQSSSLASSGSIAPGTSRAPNTTARPEAKKLFERTDHLGRRTSPLNQLGDLLADAVQWSVCPNIRPAFKALEGLGFKNLRVASAPAGFRHGLGGQRPPLRQGRLKKLSVVGGDSLRASLLFSLGSKSLPG